MPDSEKHVSTTLVWAWIAWAGAIALTVIGSAVGIEWSAPPEMRMIAIAILAWAILAVAVAVCLTIKLMLRRCSRWMVNAIELGRDGREAGHLRRLG